MIFASYEVTEIAGSFIHQDQTESLSVEGKTLPKSNPGCFY